MVFLFSDFHFWTGTAVNYLKSSMFKIHQMALMIFKKKNPSVIIFTLLDSHHHHQMRINHTHLNQS